MNILELVGWLSCLIIAMYFSIVAFVIWRFSLVGWASKYPAIITTVAASLSWYITLSTVPFSIHWSQS